MKKVNKRSRAKYPALDKALNTKARRDYIEPEYINGVFDGEGRQVIRPLTADEKEWLNKFYEETIVTSFNKDGTDLMDEIEDRRLAYRENNHRNVCLMNMKNSVGLLESYDERVFDKISYDRFSHLDHELVLIKQIEEDED